MFRQDRHESPSRNYNTEFCVILRVTSISLVSSLLSIRESHVRLACCTDCDLVMSESKDRTTAAARGPTAAPGGLALKADSAPTTQSDNPAVGAASDQGYLSKLFGSGFGIGSGTASSVTDRTPATVDEVHEYHPGNRAARRSGSAPGDDLDC